MEGIRFSFENFVWDVCAHVRIWSWVSRSWRLGFGVEGLDFGLLRDSGFGVRV